jgi:hypothetical protein
MLIFAYRSLAPCRHITFPFSNASDRILTPRSFISLLPADKCTSLQLFSSVRPSYRHICINFYMSNHHVVYKGSIAWGYFVEELESTFPYFSYHFLPSKSRSLYTILQVPYEVSVMARLIESFRRLVSNWHMITMAKCCVLNSSDAYCKNDSFDCDLDEILRYKKRELLCLWWKAC